MTRRDEDDSDAQWSHGPWATTDDDLIRRRLPRGAVAMCGVVLLVVLVLVVGRSDDAATNPNADAARPGTTGTDSTQTTSQHEHVTPVPQPHTDADVADEWDGHPGFTVTELQGDWRRTPGIRAAEAVAVLVARSWLSTSQADLDVGGLSTPVAGGWVEQLAVEATEQLDPHVVVVTLIATVYDSDLHVVRQLRLGVPVTVGTQHPTPVGEPWLLPELPLRMDTPATERVLDEHDLAAARTALDDAGYTDVDVHSLERTDSWPWRAHVDARTPDGHEVTTPVLLRRHLDGFVVAGTVLGATVEHPTSPDNGRDSDREVAR